MLHTLLLASGLALAGVQPTSDDPVHAETTIELTVSDDDTVSGTATFHLALDEGRWETAGSDRRATLPRATRVRRKIWNVSTHSWPVTRE